MKKEQKRADDLRAEAKRYKLDLQEEELRERIHNKEVELNLIMKKKENGDWNGHQNSYNASIYELKKVPF